MDWDIVAVVAAGASVFLAVSAVLWPRRRPPLRVPQRMTPEQLEKEQVAASELIAALSRRGRHLREG